MKQQAPVWCLAGVLGLVAARQVVGLADVSDLTTPMLGLDLVPVYAGAHAVAQGVDPNDPGNIQRILGEVGIRHWSSHNAYPATWGFLMMPFREIPFESLARAWRQLLLLLLVCSAPLVAFAGPVRSRAWGAVAAMGSLLVFAHLFVTRLSLDLGQTNLVLVFCSCAILLLMARSRDRAAGVVLALGAAAKLLPGVLLTVVCLRRRWRVLAAAVGVGGLVLAGTFWFVPSWDPFRYLGLTRALVAHSRFGTVDGVPAEPIVGAAAWIFSQRGLLLLLATMLPLLLLWRKSPDSDLDVAALGWVLAGFGANGAMSYTNYEAVLLLPVIGWVVSWPASRDPIRWSLPLSALAVGVLFASGLQHPVSDKDPLAWAPAAMMLWIACAARFALHLQRVPARAS